MGLFGSFNPQERQMLGMRFMSSAMNPQQHWGAGLGQGMEATYQDMLRRQYQEQMQANQDRQYQMQQERLAMAKESHEHNMGAEKREEEREREEERRRLERERATKRGMYEAMVTSGHFDDQTRESMVNHAPYWINDGGTSPENMRQQMLFQLSAQADREDEATRDRTREAIQKYFGEDLAAMYGPDGNMELFNAVRSQKDSDRRFFASQSEKAAQDAEEHEERVKNLFLGYENLVSAYKKEFSGLAQTDPKKKPGYAENLALDKMLLELKRNRELVPDVINFANQYWTNADGPTPIRDQFMGKVRSGGFDVEGLDVSRNPKEPKLGPFGTEQRPEGPNRAAPPPRAEPPQEEGFNPIEVALTGINNLSRLRLGDHFNNASIDPRDLMEESVSNIRNRQLGDHLGNASLDPRVHAREVIAESASNFRERKFGEHITPTDNSSRSARINQLLDGWETVGLGRSPFGEVGLEPYHESKFEDFQKWAKSLDIDMREEYPSLIVEWLRRSRGE